MAKEKDSMTKTSIMVDGFAKLAEAINHFEEVSERMEKENTTIRDLRKGSFLVAEGRDKIIDKKSLDEQLMAINTLFHDGTKKPITYKLKEHETEAFDNLMDVLNTDVVADAFKWITGHILEDYKEVIKEEIEWKESSIEIETIDDKNLQEIIERRMEFFTSPKNTRGNNTGRIVNCTLEPEQVELLNLLMVALSTKKAPVAYRWIMNVFVNDYGPVLKYKLQQKKRRN